MSRRPFSVLLLAFAAGAALAAAGCGKKGPPLAPLIVVPARIDDFTARRLGDEVWIRFTIPSRNQDGSNPADLEAVEVYAITGEAVDAAGRALTPEQIVRHATLVRRIEVEPPPEPPEPDAPPEPEPATPRPEDPRPAQGEVVSFSETLTDAERVPFVPPGRAPKPVPPPPAPKIAPPMFTPKGPQLPARMYVGVGVSRKGRRGPLSPRISVLLTALPPAPPEPTLTYTETALKLEWQTPPGARRPVQPPPSEGVLPARPVFPGPPPATYNVYSFDSATGAGSTYPAPLNPKPLETTTFEQSPVPLGEERCYVVRTVESHDGMTVESLPSPPACAKLQDTFAPAAPRNLAAVASEGAISLIWEPNSEADLAGYLVLRGEDGGPLQPLTESPIRETTFVDRTVRPGVRYTYAVVAVDTASPPNRSEESNRVEDTAR